MSANLENPTVTTGPELHPSSQELGTKVCLNYQKIVLTSHVRQVMFKILQVRFQQFLNQELPHIQAGFRKGRGTRDQIAAFTGSKRKQGNSRKKNLLLLHRLW